MRSSSAFAGASFSSAVNTSPGLTTPAGRNSGCSRPSAPKKIKVGDPMMSYCDCKPGPRSISTLNAFTRDSPPRTADDDTIRVSSSPLNQRVVLPERLGIYLFPVGSSAKSRCPPQHRMRYRTYRERCKRYTRRRYLLSHGFTLLLELAVKPTR